MLVRVHRDYSWSPERFYWTWPVVGSYMSHDPSIYGKLVFFEKNIKVKAEPKKENPYKNVVKKSNACS